MTLSRHLVQTDGEQRKVKMTYNVRRADIFLMFPSTKKTDFLLKPSDFYTANLYKLTFQNGFPYRPLFLRERITFRDRSMGSL